MAPRGLPKRSKNEAAFSKRFGEGKNGYHPKVWSRFGFILESILEVILERFWEANGSQNVVKTRTNRQKRGSQPDYDFTSNF